MSDLTIQYITEDGRKVHVTDSIDVIVLKSNSAIFEITPIPNRLGAFTLKCLHPTSTGVHLIVRDESAEVVFKSPKGVEVY